MLLTKLNLKLNNVEFSATRVLPSKFDSLTRYDRDVRRNLIAVGI